ncbi:hypothetical protein KAJ27_07680 [bacterium]|nr:hypothetical protein [bacterium]
MTDKKMEFNKIVNEYIDNGIDESFMKDELLLKKVNQYKKSSFMKNLYQVAAVFIIFFGIAVYFRPIAVDNGNLAINNVTEEIQIVEMVDEIELYEAMFPAS